jgi:hypothetical protein
LGYLGDAIQPSCQAIRFKRRTLQYDIPPKARVVVAIMIGLAIRPQGGRRCDESQHEYRYDIVFKPFHGATLKLWFHPFLIIKHYLEYRQQHA